MGRGGTNGCKSGKMTFNPCIYNKKYRQNSSLCYLAVHSFTVIVCHVSTYIHTYIICVFLIVSNEHTYFDVVAPPISNGTFIPTLSISRATCIISSRDGVIRPDKPIISVEKIRIRHKHTMTYVYIALRHAGVRAYICVCT